MELYNNTSMTSLGPSSVMAYTERLDQFKLVYIIHYIHYVIIMPLFLRGGSTIQCTI
jgi:hypothetical protein